MTVLYIIIGVILYLFIGGIIAGVIADPFDMDSASDKMWITMLWPLIGGGTVVYWMAMLPIRIGEKIRERINKKK